MLLYMPTNIIQTENHLLIKLNEISVIVSNTVTICQGTHDFVINVLTEAESKRNVNKPEF